MLTYRRRGGSEDYQARRKREIIGRRQDMLPTGVYVLNVLVKEKKKTCRGRRECYRFKVNERF